VRHASLFPGMLAEDDETTTTTTRAWSAGPTPPSLARPQRKGRKGRGAHTRARARTEEKPLHVRKTPHHGAGIRALSVGRA